MNNMAHIAGLVAGGVAPHFQAQGNQQILRINNDETMNKVDKENAIKETVKASIRYTSDFSLNVARDICRAADIDPTAPPSVEMLFPADQNGGIITP